MSRFDQLLDESAPLIIEQRHHREQPPVDGGRWPVSVVIFPDRALGERLDALTGELIKLAGPGHFHTGRSGSAHLTVRALERFRATIAENDPAVARYLRATRAAASRTRSFSLTITGLTVTPSAVLAGVGTGRDQVDQLTATLADELGPDDWLERDYVRSFRHLSLLHFGAAIAHPRDLIDWVADRRGLTIGSMTATAVDLIRSRHRVLDDGQLMQPERLIPSVRMRG